jgi:hypothetical protein
VKINHTACIRFCIELVVKINHTACILCKRWSVLCFYNISWSCLNYAKLLQSRYLFDPQSVEAFVNELGGIGLRVVSVIYASITRITNGPTGLDIFSALLVQRKRNGRHAVRDV